MRGKKSTPEDAPVLRFALRYGSREDYALVQRAAAAERMSMNTWLVRVSLTVARRQLAKQEAGKK